MELKNTNWKLVLVLVLIAATILVLVTTINQTTPTQSIPANQEEQQPAPQPAQRAPTTLTQEVQIFSYGYSPSTIRAIQGDNLTLELLTTDGLTHGFAIAELEISQRVEPGRTTTINVPTNNPGEYRVYSNVASHAGSGQMQATLIIEERE